MKKAPTEATVMRKFSSMTRPRNRPRTAFFMTSQPRTANASRKAAVEIQPGVRRPRTKRTAPAARNQMSPSEWLWS